MNCATIDLGPAAFDLLDAVPDALLIANEHGRVIYVSTHVEPLLGWLPDDLLSEPIELLLPERFRREHIAQRNQCRQRPHVYPRANGLKLHVLAKDGRHIPVELSLGPLQTEKGLLVVYRIRDVTERTLVANPHRLDEAHLEAVVWRRARRGHTEEAVQESRAFLQAIIDGIPEAVRVIDRDCRVVLANRVTRERDGLEESPAGKTRCYELAHGRDTPCTGAESPSPLQEVIATKAPVTVTHTHRDCAGNELVVEVLAAPIFDNAGEVAQIVESCRDITERKAAETKLKTALAEITQLKDRLQLANAYLWQKVRLQQGRDQIVGASPGIKAVLSQIEQVGPTESTVLIQGETGTGKELVARAVHALSARKQRAMIHVNCAALPGALIESELFGREKGAYTGALSKQMGRFESADKSTIFLDEIAELPLEVQGTLLRVLEHGQFEHLGSSRTTAVDVRVIAATNRDLGQEVRQGSFREDLYYRLNVFQISVPPLRERLEDVPQLAWVFVDLFSKSMGKSIEVISQSSMDALQRYTWPGNVRELKNMIERAMILCNGPTLRIPVPVPARPIGRTNRTLESVEREHIESVLRITGWRVRGTGGAAEILGLKPTTLDARMAKLGIQRPRPVSNIR